ncbi:MULTISPECIES: Maf family protein [unclassified Lysobacter]
MIHLASRSPRRRELLARLGVPFEVLQLDVAECQRPDEAAESYVCRVAGEKARAGLLERSGDPDALVLGADTEVVLAGEVFGKPGDVADAAAMLRRLSGRTHQVISAVSLVSAGRQLQAVSISEVTFAVLTEARIQAYVGGGEPFGKAGGYAIQGFAEAFVTRLAGSYSGVMGLPLYETSCLLAQFDLGPASTPDAISAEAT